MAKWTQDKRIMAIETPLGKDELLLAGIKGTEGLSTLFSFDLELLSEKKDIAFEKIIGKEATVILRSKGPVDQHKDVRYFHGIISRFSQGGKCKSKSSDNTVLYYYEATLVPWLWLLTRTADSRVFQKKSALDIVKQIFDDHGFKDYKSDVRAEIPAREFFLQYRETDFNFVSRLMEEEGIAYYFAHDKNKHTLVLTDSPDKDCPKQENANFIVDLDKKSDSDFICRLDKTRQILPVKYNLRDFNYELPQKPQEADQSGKTLGPGQAERYEIYDYPGRFDKKDRGQALAKTGIQSLEAQGTILSGAGDCRAFTGGYVFQLKNHQSAKMNVKYLLTSVTHQGDILAEYVESFDPGFNPGLVPQVVRRMALNPALEQSSGTAISIPGCTGAVFEKMPYSNAFECIPADVPYRPPHVTPKPVVRGPQTAIVVGPNGNKGEEIHMDKLGRVKIQFHWDREGKNDDKSSCWVRVGQVWAGNQWGAQFIPRTGHEVLVDFLEGDPDRPIITGSVYHEQNKLPYEGDPTKTGFKSKSYEGNKTVAGFNELRFEDKKKSEEIYLHAEKDWNIDVLNDQKLTVGNDRTKTVKNDQTEIIEEGNKTIEVRKGNHTETIQKGNVQIEVTKGKIMITTGKDNITIDSGKEIKYIAKDQITLECGSSKMVMKKNGTITVNGKDFTKDMSGKIAQKASGNITVKGSKVAIN